MQKPRGHDDEKNQIKRTENLGGEFVRFFGRTINENSNYQK
jgi:hypothetical protein